MSGEARLDELRLLVAEIEDERSKVERLVLQFDHAKQALSAPQVDSLVTYGAAALLESFYTGVEKILHRIASKLGGLPSGNAWHRELLESMALDLETVRPPVLERQTVAELDAYLAFRHRFRNLYVFDLEHEPMQRLLSQGRDAWERFDHDLASFVARVRGWIRTLEPSGS